MQSRYEAVLDSLEAGVVIHAADTSILEANERARVLLGLNDLEGRLATDPEWQFFESDRSPMVLDRFPVMQVIASGKPLNGLVLMIRPPGKSDVWCEVSAVPVVDDVGQLREVVVTFIDITERKRVEEELIASEELLRVVLDTSSDATFRTGPDHRIEYVNQRVAEISGIPAGQWIGKRISDMGLPAELARVWEARRSSVFSTGESVTFEFEIDNIEGHRWYETTIAPGFDPDGMVVRTIETSRDFTDRKAASDALQELSTHDPLTGLANRTELLNEITRALGAGHRLGRAIGVVLMDLDRFKDVNDTLGHAAGDELLIAAAARVESVARDGDLVARLGGDEFVVVMRDLEDPSEALAVAMHLLQAFRTPFMVREVELYSPTSIGVAITTDGEDADDLMREADTALYSAKEAGRDRVAVFNEELRAAITGQLAVEADLRHALTRGQLDVWYQPEIDLETGSVIALEALLRWHHPDGSVWTADRFVDVAEQTGQIQEIGDWVLNQACQQAADWAAKRPGQRATVRVNMSTLQIAMPGLLSTLDRALAASGLDPGLLCIEITETVLLRQSAIARDNIAGIHERGASIAIDDFGTGYASLTYLNHYPIDVIKIDRSFIADITLLGHNHRLVAGIIALATLLGITVTAEGVERPAQVELLRQMGCPSAQGFLFSRALPADEITPLLDRRYLTNSPALG